VKVEFEYFEKPKRVNNETINFLRDKGKYFLCHIKEKKFDYYGNKILEEKERIIYVSIYPSITIFAHNYFLENEWDNTEILGYCVLELPENINISI